MTVLGLEAGLVTADGAALAAFYVDGFGFTVERVLEFPQGTVRRLQNGGAQLKIFEPSDRPEALDNRPWNGAAGFRYAALHVDDAAAVVASARDAGGTVLTGVTSHRPDACFALIADPEGNVWEILAEGRP